MSITRSRCLSFVTSAVLLLAGSTVLMAPACDPSVGDDDDGECSDELRFVSDPVEACDVTFCGEPTLSVGTGATAFEPLSDGDDVIINYGSQGGYHIYLAAEMEHLCPVVYLNFELLVDLDGELLSIWERPRHVQAVQQVQGTSIQAFWGVQGRLSCEWYPNDPNHELGCQEPGLGGYLEDYEVVIRVSARDHNENRVASGEVRVQPIFVPDEK